MNAALYIHFPFCSQKCTYCDFCSIIEDQYLIDQYLESLNREILIHAQNPIFHDFIFETIYFGGGTPSLLSPRQLEMLLNCIHKNFRVDKNDELTIEVNPETIDIEKLKAFRSLGINRISIGVQSFKNSELRILGRIHDVETAISSIQHAKKVGFENVSIDLMFGIPGQSLKDWHQNLDKAVKFSPQHISIYGLTIEPGTLLEKQITEGLVKPSSEMMEREMYRKGIEILKANRFQHYEISNFGQPGFFSRHNQMYWNGNPYLGLGPAAHSFWKDHRQWNVSNIFEYNKFLHQNSLPLENQEQLTDEQKLIEFVLLSLRTKEGINFDLFKLKYNIDFQQKYRDQIRQIKSVDDGNLIQIDNKGMRLTDYGFLLYDEICSYFN